VYTDAERDRALRGVNSDIRVPWSIYGRCSESTEWRQFAKRAYDIRERHYGRHLVSPEVRVVFRTVGLKLNAPSGRKNCYGRSTSHVEWMRRPGPGLLSLRLDSATHSEIVSSPVNPQVP
jgi:hypothetical protein